MRFEIPIDPKGGLNAREHWAARAKRVKAERAATAAYAPLPYAWRELRKEGETFCVHLIRYAPRLVDSDNWVGRAKAVRDEVARLLGIDDGDSRLTWNYSQRKEKRARVLVWVHPAECPETAAAGAR